MSLKFLTMRPFRELVVWQKSHRLTIVDLGLVSVELHAELEKAVVDVKRMLTSLARRLVADARASLS